ARAGPPCTASPGRGASARAGPSPRGGHAARPGRAAPGGVDVSERPTPPAPSRADDELRELDARIDRFARRRAHARARRGKSLWAQSTAVGTLGWLIAVPIVAGALLGHLLDRRLGSGITWAMAFMG